MIGRVEVRVEIRHIQRQGVVAGSASQSRQLLLNLLLLQRFQLFHLVHLRALLLRTARRTMIPSINWDSPTAFLRSLYESRVSFLFSFARRSDSFTVRGYCLICASRLH
jgi:hypothetical protein